MQSPDRNRTRKARRSARLSNTARGRPPCARPHATPHRQRTARAISPNQSRWNPRQSTPIRRIAPAIHVSIAIITSPTNSSCNPSQSSPLPPIAPAISPNQSRCNPSQSPPLPPTAPAPPPRRHHARRGRLWRPEAGRTCAAPVRASAPGRPSRSPALVEV